MRATLALRFEYDGVRTVFCPERQEPPWKTIRAFQSPAGHALLHLNNLSGGVLAGDELRLELRLATKARAQVTSTGATRLYRSCATEMCSRISTVIDVASDALLEFLPDPVIPFAFSRCSVNNSIRLAEGATLFWWESVWPGREAAGEVFQFHRLRMETEIRYGKQALALERLDLAPRQRPLDSPARMGGFRYFGTLYICRPGEPHIRWQEMESELVEIAGRISCANDAVTWGVSRLPAHGLLVRGLARTNASIASGLLEFWGASKLHLTGQPAVLPRKTY